MLYIIKCSNDSRIEMSLEEYLRGKCYVNICILFHCLHYFLENECQSESESYICFIEIRILVKHRFGPQVLHNNIIIALHI